MMNITPRKLYQEVCKVLLSPSLLAELGIDKEMIKRGIEETTFIATVTHIAEASKYTSQEVYKLLNNILDKLWGDLKPENPLYYIYQYTLSLSFPNSVEISLMPQWTTACQLYLKVLDVICNVQKKSRDNTLQSRFPISFLTEKEMEKYKVFKEYSRFVDYFNKEHIYEMMKLNQEVIGHNTLDHICGVHYLSMFIGKQLFESGVPIDLGRVSGGAAGHDLGKFGCKSCEGNRVAYLHYYYTDLWFKDREITYIGHIALNHSVWDLELENLSIESLVLIYSDFRVKNAATDDGKYEMKVFSLVDSFKVILDKLDNVDAAKERRYRRVYNKLKDFEDYMLSLGVETDPLKPPTMNFIKDKKYYSLMKGNIITEHIKYLAIKHNINLMHKFRDETSLNEILELVRSEKDPKALREYLDVFNEYSTYLTQKQKLITLRFLYEKLIHQEEDIRRQCSELMGSLIGTFDESYRKEIPEGVVLPSADITSSALLDNYLNQLVFPDHKMIPLHKSWIGYSIRVLISSLFETYKGAHTDEFKAVILKYFKNENSLTNEINPYLLDTIRYIPFIDEDSALATVYSYIEKGLNSSNNDIRIASYDTVYRLRDSIKNHTDIIQRVNSLLNNDVGESLPAENYIKLKLSKALATDEGLINYYQDKHTNDLDRVSDIFLSNLKTATNWTTKKIQVELLFDYYLQQEKISGLYTAMHFCNILKVSAIETVRNKAGKSLVDIFPHLPLEQRNDIAIELLRALEIEGYQFTKYIPKYLGQILVYLQPFELDELLDDLISKIKQSNAQINSLLLKTVGILIANYNKYKDVFNEGEEAYQYRLNKMLGILLNGLVHDDYQIKQISFSVIGKEIFNSKVLSLSEKHLIFQQIAKKILTLLTDTEASDLLFLTNSSGLNNIYRFITEYIFKEGTILIHSPSQVAFFPGTFDPFTLGHKEIAKAIRDYGFEVYLAVDEFSWSKRTQPNLIRKKIINMSIADEMDIYLYPEDFPTNLSNPSDLKKLKENFDDTMVYIVVGSDVLIHASAYKAKEKQYSIHNFPHIIFERRSLEDTEEVNEYVLSSALNKINAPLIRLNLPPQYEDISSTQIRTNIDENRDISRLIDPLAQRFIYENNLYRKEPQYKSLVQTLSIEIEEVDDLKKDIVAAIVNTFHSGYPEAYDNIRRIFNKPNGRMIVIRDLLKKGEIIAYSMFHWSPSGSIFSEFNNSTITDFIRNQYKGRIIILDGIFVAPNAEEGLYQITLTETLANCLKADYSYAVYKNNIDGSVAHDLHEIIKLHGFIPLPYNEDTNPVFAVDMSNPCTLNLDIETIIKEPFKSNANVIKAIKETRQQLQKALTNLYPGHLIISFDRRITDETLVRKICEENNVLPFQTKPRKLGEFICVPFGNVLNRMIVPNTITKSLHTEKMFAPDLNNFSIGAYPYYLDLENQMKMIRSFNKPVILVDDLLNKGYRIKALDPLLKKENIEVKKIIVGILSGKGKELMEIQDREVDAAYFIPKLRLWFNETLLYPFIGGDTLWRGKYPEKNLLPSINLISPYTSPAFIKGVSNEAIYNLSEVSISNSLKLLETLESEYQRLYERKLTLSLLGEVMLYPRCPDHGENMYYDLNINPSNYLNNDLEILRRLRVSIISSHTRGVEYEIL